MLEQAKGNEIRSLSRKTWTNSFKGVSPNTTLMIVVLTAYSAFTESTSTNMYVLAYECCKALFFEDNAESVYEILISGLIQP